MAPKARRAIAGHLTRLRNQRYGQVFANTTVSRRGPAARVRRVAALKTAAKAKTATKLTTKVKTSRDGPVSDSYARIPAYHQISLKKFKVLTSPSFYVTNDVTRVTWTDGLQTAAVSNALFQGGDLTALYTNYATIVPPTATASNTTKLYIERVFSEMMITNQTNDVSSVTLYDCISRRDNPIGSSYSNPATAWAQGAADAGTATAYTVVGSTPFQTPGFGEWWKICKITKIDLHSGGHHRHVVNFAPKKIFSYELQGGAAAPNYFKDWTCFTMIVCHGFPVNATGGTTPSTASGAIDIVSKKQYEFRSIGINKTRVTVANNLSVLATESFINDLTGAATTLTTA